MRRWKRQIPVATSDEAGKPSHSRIFESWGEFVEETSKTPKDSESSAHCREYSWCGNASFTDACRLAVAGWEEGTALASKFADALFSELSNSLKIDDYYYDVTGQDFDLDRVLTGEPEAWLNSEQVEVKAPALQNLKIQVNLMASGGIDAKVLIQRGAAIAALVMLLEKARRRVEVELVVPNGWLDGFWSDVRITAKRAGDDLDLAKIVFAVAHPATFRRLYFGLLEISGKEVRDSLGAYRDRGYGHCIDLPIELRDGDIYSPMAMYRDVQWTNEETAKQWILDQLKLQGVELKEEIV